MLTNLNKEWGIRQRSSRLEGRPVATGGRGGAEPPLEKFEPPLAGLGCPPWHFIGIGIEVYSPPGILSAPPTNDTWLRRCWRGSLLMWFEAIERKSRYCLNGESIPDQRGSVDEHVNNRREQRQHGGRELGRMTRRRTSSGVTPWGGRLSTRVGLFEMDLMPNILRWRHKSNSNTPHTSLTTLWLDNGLASSIRENTHSPTQAAGGRERHLTALMKMAKWELC